MNITIHLAPEIEQRLREKAGQRGQSLQEYLQRLAEESLGNEHMPQPLSAEQWEAQLRAWVASHADWPAEFDDSRESIYEGRGE
jgi:hypothetical protein